jgi:hypothetical protein
MKKTYKPKQGNIVKLEKYLTKKEKNKWQQNRA